MEQSYIEYFHGNNREIENEKQRKRELMSHFPKTLGTVDETRYVLHDDEKQKQTDYFESKPVSPLTVAPAKDEPLFNIRGIGEQQSEKPKKDVSMQTAVQGIANFGNKENPLGFGNWKSASTLFSLQKEKNETKAPKSPFGIDNNVVKEEKKPFDLGAQFQGLGNATCSKPRTKTVKNDSLRLGSKEMENIADSLKRGNVNNTNTVPNNGAMAKPNIPPGLYGGKPDRDYTEDLRKVKQNLPAIALDILNNSGIKIIVLDNLHSVTKNGKIIKRTGRYFADKKKIYLDSKNVDEYTLISEIFHVAQDKLGMTGVGKSNLEFQEHVIKDLYFKQLERRSNNYDNSKGFSTTDDENYPHFIEDIFSKDGILDFNKFQKDINFYFDKFQKYYSEIGAYQEPGIENYDYNWKMILDLFGIKYK